MTRNLEVTCVDKQVDGGMDSSISFETNWQGQLKQYMGMSLTQHKIIYYTPFNLSISNICLSLTHWGRVMYIFISALAMIGSDNGLSPGRRQAII